MKIPKTFFASCVLFALLLMGCSFNATYSNRDADKADAEKVVTQFFGYLKTKNYDATFALLSKDLLATTNKEKMKNLYTFSDDKLGDIQRDSLSQWQTKVITGTSPSARYEFIYKNQYQKGPADVDILLTKDPDGKIRILGYHVNSDVFYAK